MRASIVETNCYFLIEHRTHNLRKTYDAVVDINTTQVCSVASTFPLCIAQLIQSNRIVVQAYPFPQLHIIHFSNRKLAFQKHFPTFMFTRW